MNTTHHPAPATSDQGAHTPAHWGYHATDNTLRKDGKKVAFLCTLPEELTINTGPIPIAQSLEITGALNAHHAAQERIARLQKALAGAQSEAAFIKWVVAEKARPTVLTLHEIRESAIRITKLSTNETA